MSLREEVEKANREAVERMMNAEPKWVDIAEARKAIGGLNKGMKLLHAGPPISWDRASGPLRGALIGAAIFEGWADSPERAESMLRKGEIVFEPTHNHGAVGPMAGVISPSMPVIVVRDPSTGVTAFSNLNEGIGRVLRYGAYSREVIDRLRWMSSTLFEVLKIAVDQSAREGYIDLKAIISQALHMGDECHNRHVAATSIFLNTISILLAEGDAPRDKALEVLRFIKGNTFFFLNFAMAAAKVMALSAHGIKYSTIVTVLSRNGTDAGAWVSGLGDRWFTARARVPKGVFFPGYSQEDANPDIGDSSITETAGFGGFAMAAAPAVVSWVGGSVEFAVRNTENMYSITYTTHRYFTIPYLGFKGTPTGVDVRKVVRTGIEPTINTGIAHRNPGVGQIGAGIVSFPIDLFKNILRAYAEHYGL